MGQWFPRRVLGDKPRLAQAEISEEDLQSIGIIDEYLPATYTDGR